MEKLFDTVLLVFQVLVARLFLLFLDSLGAFHVMVDHFLALWLLFAFLSQFIELVNTFLFILFILVVLVVFVLVLILIFTFVVVFLVLLPSGLVYRSVAGYR